jgi:hypothetical protein
MQPRYTKQYALAKDDESIDSQDRKFKINNQPYEQIVLRRLTPKNDLIAYNRAQSSYDSIYTAIQFRGTPETEYKVDNLMGKPIQLDPDNMFPLLIDEFYVSTKADGLRFFLMIAEDVYLDYRERGIQATDELKFTHKAQRYIFFIDSKRNFWRLESSGKIQDHLYFTDIDKCLIDGELLFFPNDVKIVLDEDGEVAAYYIQHEGTKSGNRRPFVVFLAFDIIYGPTDPMYKYEKHVEEGLKLENTAKINDLYRARPEVKDTTLIFGSNQAKMGFKEESRWPTINRRMILQEMFINVLSPLRAQLTDMSRIGNFTILLSPFLDLNDVLAADDPYEYAKDIYVSELNKQFRSYTNFNLTDLTLDRNLRTDGLIFTPKYKSYLVDMWSLGRNKQYKSKPKNELTIDFKLGSEVSPDKYECYVDNDPHPYHYSGTQVFIKDAVHKSVIRKMINDGKPIFVECNYQQQSITDDIIFTIKKFREDKLKANASKTASSTLSLLHGPMARYDMLNFAKNLRRRDIHLNTDPSILEVISPGVKNQLVMCMDPITILNIDHQQFLSTLYDMISKRKSHELECRIGLEDPRDIVKTVLSEALGGKYKSIPMVRYYKDTDGEDGEKETYRATFAELEKGSLILQDISTKRTINTVSVPMTDLYNKRYVKKCSVVLAKEEIIPDDYLDDLLRSGQVVYNKTILADIIEKGSDSIHKNMLMNMNFDKFKLRMEKYGPSDEDTDIRKYAKMLLKDSTVTSDDNISISQLDPDITDSKMLTEKISKGMTIPTGRFEYQVRYIINNLSDYWSIEIIEYGKSSGRMCSYLEALKNYGDGPNVKGSQTRIEIEYKPFEMYVDMIKYLELNDSYKKEEEEEETDEEEEEGEGEEKGEKGEETPGEEEDDEQTQEYKRVQKQLYDKFETFDIVKIRKMISNAENVTPEIIAEDCLKLLFKVLNGIYI